MSNEVKDKEIQQKDTESTSKPKKSISNPLMQILNGEFLSKEFVVKNLGFLFYVILLLILLVGKGYYDKRLRKKVETQQRELDELTGDYVAKKARLEVETKRITLVKELAPKGLKETENPTKVIRVPRQE